MTPAQQGAKKATTPAMKAAAAEHALAVPEDGEKREQDTRVGERLRVLALDIHLADALRDAEPPEHVARMRAKMAVERGNEYEAPVAHTPSVGSRCERPVKRRPNPFFLRVGAHRIPGYRLFTSSSHWGAKLPRRRMNKKVVVIDDEPSVQEVVRGYLEKDGYLVYVAGSGQEGLPPPPRPQPPPPAL